MASVFGSVECSIKASPATVRVGDNITVVSSSSTVTVSGNAGVTLISGPTLDNGKYVLVYKAITAGDVNFKASGGCNATVKVYSRDLPFKFFAKLFGLGKPE
ncbi:MAG: hypothetical protein GYA60_10535 [Candidatus Methanofastidiosa archaeon]|nr:hypothetical protein [Candidatus Methanofastidiosa archaeon]